MAGTEEPPDPATDADKYAKYVLQKHHALTTIVLGVDPSLLYLLGDPVDPAAVWKKLSGQFQKKTWGNKLRLREKQFTMKLTDSERVHRNIRRVGCDSRANLR